MYPNPNQTVNLTESAQQFRKSSFTIKVESVAAGVLRHNDQFFHAVGCKLLCFLYQFLHRAGAVFAAQLGDDAEGAPIVAALRDFQISIIFRCCENPAVFRLGGVDVVEALVTLAGQNLSNGIRNIVIRTGSKDTINFRQFLQNFFLIALGQTAGHKNLLDSALCLQLRHGQNVVDSLCLGGLNKAAGVDNNEFCAVRVGADLIACLPQQPEHMFGIDLIFGAAKRDHAYRMGHDMSSSVISSSSSPTR